MLESHSFLAYSVPKILLVCIEPIPTRVVSRCLRPSFRLFRLPLILIREDGLIRPVGATSSKRPSAPALHLSFCDRLFIRQVQI